MRLSFLEKNAKTVDESSRVISPLPTSYSALTFIDEPPVSSPSRVAQDQASPAATSTSKSNPLSPDSTEDLHGYASLGQLEPTVTLSPASSIAVPVLSGNDGQTPDQFDVGDTPSDEAYESALDILLSLGAGHAPTNHTDTPEPAPDTFLSPEVTRSPDEFPNCAHLSQDRIVKTMRQYRYNIAPWLDLGDPHGTFGLVIPRVALRSMSVFESLFSLSLTSPDDNVTSDPPQDDVPSFFSKPMEFPTLDRLLVTTFHLLQQHITSPPNAWQPALASMGMDQFRLVPPQGQEKHVLDAISWLVLRLELSVGLMNGSRVGIPETLANAAASPAVGFLERPLEFSQGPLLLCAETLNFCSIQEYVSTPTDGLPTNRVGCWKNLFASLNTWYNTRPEEFHPMLELEEAGRFFPLILFTSGAALLANQIYHTATLLLLLHRPRTLQHEYGRSFIMSPLWHAQRICGISLNNSSRDCWDFSLVASLFLAAKQMTYEPQQREILSGLENIRAITKWNLDHLATKLIQGWKPA